MVWFCLVNTTVVFGTKMNKRLLLTLYDRSGLGAYMPVDYNGHELEVAEHMEKFTELIVGECMRMCDVAAIGYESHGHMKEANGCYSAKEYIEEHFGVEE